MYLCPRGQIGKVISLKRKSFLRSTRSGGTSISTSDLTLATEEVRDLWQVRVGEIYFGICLKFTLLFV